MKNWADFRGGFLNLILPNRFGKDESTTFRHSMRNWADDLPEDILNLILSNLFGKDRHTFSQVCRSWKQVATTSLYRCYSPCLMYYDRRSHMWKFYQYNSFFSMCFPELDKAEIRCSKYGWLLMSRYNNSLFFFDPFNHRKIELPCKIDFGYTTVSFFHPPTSRCCTVVGIATPRCKPAVRICTLRRGEGEWEIKEYSSKGRFGASHADPVLHRGFVHIVDVKGNIAELDIYDSRLLINYRCFGKLELGTKIKEHYLCKIKGEDDLFAVFVLLDERKVLVLRLLEPEMKWKLVKDIGEKVLYLSHSSSFGDTAYLPNMANRIYFPRFHGDSAVFYSLSDEKYHSLDDNYSDNNCYGLERLDFATWIRPAPSTEEVTRELTWFSDVD